MPKPRLNKRQEKTIENMRNTRVSDAITLRKTIEEKLEWAKNEKQKGLSVIEKQLQQVKENKEIVMKLTVVIEVLSDILKPKEEAKEE